MSAEESVAMGRMSGVSPPSYDMYCACRVESDLACICAFEFYSASHLRESGGLRWLASQVTPFAGQLGDAICRLVTPFDLYHTLRHIPIRLGGRQQRDAVSDAGRAL